METVIEYLTPGAVNAATRVVYQAYKVHSIEDGTAMRNHAFSDMQEMFRGCKFRPVFLMALLNNIVAGIVGYIEAPFDFDTYIIFWLTVDPEYQNNGIGTQLMSRALADLRAKKCRYVLLATNEMTGFFASKFSFKQVDPYKNGGATNNLMSLALI